MAVTYEPNVVTIYIDGGVRATCQGITKNPSMLPQLTSAFLGKAQDPRLPYFTGEIANFKWFTGILGGTSVANLPSPPLQVRSCRPS